MRRMLRLVMTLSAALIPVACDAQQSDGRADAPARPAEPAATACAIETDRLGMPAALRESSGIARAADGTLWTHNDGAEARLYRVSEAGAIEQVVTLDGVTALDIEDIDAGPCPSGSGDCLYLADIGDNEARRSEVAVLVVPGPAPGAQRAAASRVAFRYAAGPRDAEALAVLPNGELLVVTKGHGAPIELFRLPPGAGAGAAPVLERVRELGPRPESNGDRVTGAGASEDGAWIAIRTIDELGIYRTAELLAGARPAVVFDLDPLAEQQGEGVDIASDGRVWLTSEGERGAALLARLRCVLPE